MLGEKNALPAMLLPIKLGIGGRLGRGTQWLSWIHIQDLVSAIDHIMVRVLSGDVYHNVYNLVAPNPVQQIEFTRIAANIHHRFSCIPTPAILMKLVLGEQADLLLEGQRVVPNHLLMESFKFDYPTLDVALKQLAKKSF